MKQIFGVLSFLLCFNGVSARGDDGILNENILDADSITRLQIELQALDGITTTKAPAVNATMEEDEFTTTSSAVKKIEKIETPEKTEKEEQLKDTEDYVELDRFF
jgi:hypothetical protein